MVWFSQGFAAHNSGSKKTKTKTRKGIYISAETLIIFADSFFPQTIEEYDKYLLTYADYLNTFPG